MTDTYPSHTIRTLLETDFVTPATRAALDARLQAGQTADDPPVVFDAPLFKTLRAVIMRILPNAPTPAMDNARRIASQIDEQLASGKGDGWRYDALPPDEEAFALGLRGIEASAQNQFQRAFTELADASQDTILRAVQDGNAPGDTWKRLPSARFFEDLLATVSELYYSDPLVQEQIGYVGMADAHGWTRIQLDQLEAWEPRANTETYTPPILRAAPAPMRETLNQDESPTPTMRRYPLNETVDAVIIGTGAGGAPLLARLAEAGLHVVALEAGNAWTPSSDFATDERAQSKLFWADERLSAGDDPLAFGNNNSGIGVGGSTLHYTAYVPRAQADDFHLHRDFGLGMDWTIPYTDLEPYYDEIEAFLGVSGPSPYPWGAPRRPYPLPPLPVNGAGQLMEKGCAALGIRTSPAANAALSAPYYQKGVGWRPACTNRGFCQAGCSTGAKASMDVTFIPRAVAAGAEIRPECFVTRLETNAEGAITAVVYTHDGIERRQPCKTVFLCGGAVETPRLLLINGIANSSGQVGRNFMAHVGTQVWGQFDQDVRPYKGIPGALISEDTHRPADANFAGGYLLQSIGVMPVTYATQLARGRGLWGEALDTHMRGYNHTAGINILGECLPYDYNFMELSDELDRRGLPKPRIHFTYGENETRLSAHAERLMRAIWAEAGAHDVWSFKRSAHIIGTCRMGDDPRDAVVDSDGRSFDVPNLYICDNSVFPSALSVNPALTIMALSLRCADHYLETLRRNEV